MDAAEFWQKEKLDALAWMFKGDETVNAEMKALVDSRANFDEKLSGINSLTAMIPGCKRSEKLSWQLTQLECLRKDFEARFCRAGILNDKRDQRSVITYGLFCYISSYRHSIV